ncbi:S-adenosyl-L-methionine-dependent methyltransferase [Sarocladium strictum]
MADQATIQLQQALDSYDKHVGSGTRPCGTYLANTDELVGLTNPDSIVLDNACGTAVVTEAIIRRCRRENLPLPRIYAADIKDSLTSLATYKLQSLDAGDRVTVHVTPGEKLDFPDDTFTHSITSCGFPFFADADAGAREVLRTLKPGGIAVCTAAAHLDYFAGGMLPAQDAAKPDAEPTVNPMEGKWDSEAPVGEFMRRNGFKDVKTTSHRAFYSADTHDELNDKLLGLWWMIKPTWSDEERKKFSAVFREKTKEHAVECTQWDGSPGIGWGMTFTVAYGRK